MSYGIQIRSTSGDVTFELSSRLTTLIMSRVVGRDAKGSAVLDVPKSMHFSAQAIPLDGDIHMRHVPHKLSYHAGSRTLSWAPSISNEAELEELDDWASPRRSRSRIVVFGYMPEAT